MNEEVYVERTGPRSAPSLARRVSWGAVFAGLFVTIVIQLTLTLLGASIGAAAVEPLREAEPTKGLALGTGIWLLVSGLISIYCGACVAGRLSGGPRRADGMLHGIVTWSAATLATLALMTTAAGALLGGTGTFLSHALAGVQSNPSGQNALGTIAEQAKNKFPQAGSLLPPTGRNEAGQTPGTLTEIAQKDPQVAAALARMEKNGGAAQSPEDRDQIVSILSTQQGFSREEASNLVNQWDQQFQQTKGQVQQKARQAGDVAARGISKGALWGFIALFLGMLVAAWGGWAGTASLRRYDEVGVAPA